MQKTHDYVYRYYGLHSVGGICRIRIYEEGRGVPVVIASELPENDNTSITNMAEYLAAEIIAKHFPHRFEEDIPIAWIEHYPAMARRSNRERDTDYSSVTFASYTPRIEHRFGRERILLGTPEWKHLPKEAVEQLIGQPLADKKNPRAGN